MLFFNPDPRRYSFVKSLLLVHEPTTCLNYKKVSSYPVAVKVESTGFVFIFWMLAFSLLLCTLLFSFLFITESLLRFQYSLITWFLILLFSLFLFEYRNISSILESSKLLVSCDVMFWVTEISFICSFCCWRSRLSSLIVGLGKLYWPLKDLSNSSFDGSSEQFTKRNGSCCKGSVPFTLWTELNPSVAFYVDWMLQTGLVSRELWIFVANPFDTGDKFFDQYV